MTETEKCTKDVQRGTNRFSKDINIFSGVNCESLVKSKKERTKKLSAVNRASIEMSADVAFDNKEEELNSSNKKFKLPRKPGKMFIDDCNAVDHASVPRKLRSATKKRGRESISPPFPGSEKLNQSVGVAESSTSDVKNCKQNVRKGNRKLCEKTQASGSITKDEEEVVEALYNLAGMFCGNEVKDEIDSGSRKKNKLECSDNQSAFQEHTEKSSLQPTIDGSVEVNNELSSIVQSKSDEGIHPASSKERLPEKNIQITSSNEVIVHESVNQCSSQNCRGESDSFITPLSVPSTLAKHIKQNPTHNSVNICSVPMTYHNTVNLMKTSKPEPSLLNIKSEIAPVETTLIGSQLPRPLAAKIPAWHDAALSAARPVTYGPLTGKIFSKVDTDRRSWKRCAYHVYISHLTQVFKVPVGKDSMELHRHQLKPHDKMTQDFDGVNNGRTGTTAFEKVGTLGKKSNEARSYSFQTQKLWQIEQQPTTASGMYVSKKRDFSFLSLSAGGTETDIKGGIFGVAKGLVPLAQSQVPLTNHGLYPGRVPFSMSQTSLDKSFSDQASGVTATAVHQAGLQLPSYIGKPLRVSHANPPAQKQQPQHPHNSQQLWMTHLSAQYETDRPSTALLQLPNWQNGRRNLNPLMGCAQPLTLSSSSPSPATLEVAGSRYPPSFLHL